MCEGTCGDLTDPCSGTCVTGKFVGLHVNDNKLSPSELEHRTHYQAIAIHEFAIAKASLPLGCDAGGGLWNPDGHTDYAFIPND